MGSLRSGQLMLFGCSKVGTKRDSMQRLSKLFQDFLCGVTNVAEITKKHYRLKVSRVAKL